MPKIIVSVADAQLFLLLRHVLAEEGFDSLLVTKPDDMVAVCRREVVAAILIDWSEDQPEKEALLRGARVAAANCALILLSRCQAAKDLTPAAYDLLLERPFSPDILLQFLRRLRCLYVAKDHVILDGTKLRFADLEMDLAAETVHRAGQDVHLSALQFRLLRYLLQAPTAVCERQRLIANCWPDGVDVEPRTVDIHIGHIRRALKSCGPDLIRTVHARGYALQMPARPADVVAFEPAPSKGQK